MRIVEDVEFLLFVKFRPIPFNLIKEEFENVSANQRPGRLSCSSIRPKIEKLVDDNEFLLPVYFDQIPFSDFRKEGKTTKILMEIVESHLL